ncbi:MAG TPA: CpXC domain-containing protein [Kofleriaceae bacterium]
MPLPYPVSFTCSCGTQNTGEAERSWRANDPATLERLLTNNFHRYTCTSCGRSIGLELDLLVIHHEPMWIIQVVREDAKLQSAIDSVKQMAPEAKARVVANRMELMERVRIFTAGLDDVALEIARLFREVTIVDPQPGTRLWFERVDGDQIVFTAVTPTKVLGQIKSPVAMLEKIAREYQTARYAQFSIVDRGLAIKITEAPKPA